jgi:hypothetical protein
MMGGRVCAACDAIYSRKLPPPGGATEPFGWLCNMAVVGLPGGGCLVYSPVLDADGEIEGVVAALEARIA